MKNKQDVEVNDIVQLGEANEGWAFCLLVVSEVKSFGVQGYIQIPMKKGQAYLRVKWGDFELTGGKVIWSVNEGS